MTMYESAVQAQKTYSGVTLMSAENFHSVREGMNSTGPPSKARSRGLVHSVSMKSNRAPRNYQQVSVLETQPAAKRPIKAKQHQVSVSSLQKKHNQTRTSNVPATTLNPMRNNRIKAWGKKKSLSTSAQMTKSASVDSPIESSTDSSACASLEDLSSPTVHANSNRQRRGSRPNNHHSSLLNNAVMNSAKFGATSSSCDSASQTKQSAPVRWIINDLSEKSSAYPYIVGGSPCMKCGTADYATRSCNKTGKSNVPPVKGRLHYLVHYTAGQPVTRYDYAYDKCPMCNKCDSLTRTLPPDIPTDETYVTCRHPDCDTGSSFDSESSTLNDTTDSSDPLLSYPQTLCYKTPAQIFHHRLPPPSPYFTFNFSTPAFPHSSNVYLDLTGHEVKINVHRLPLHDQTRRGYRSCTEGPPKSPPIPISSMMLNHTSYHTSQWYGGQPVNYFFPNNYMYLLPEPIREPRSRDVFNSLKTCLVPAQELKMYQASQPPRRMWRHLVDPTPFGIQFTLLCYNVLCPKYATNSMYPYCPSWALNWDYRRRGILEEITVYNADIICLQELEMIQYEEVFKVEFEKNNYQSLFLPKSRHRHMGEADSKNVDGCAIFWKESKFEKVKEFQHEFSHSCTNVSDNPAPLLLNRVMTRDNVAVGVIFESKDPNMLGRKFCVTNGHIHWDPEFSDVKLIQTIIWTAELWRHIDSYLRSCAADSQTPEDPSSIPVILCGDLNSLPDSGVCEYLLKGFVNRSHGDFMNHGSKYAFDEWTSLENWALEGEELRHKFRFDRAYKMPAEMKWTNYTYDFRGIIDYVYFTRDHFRILGSLDMIDENWFIQEKIVGCPHVHFHSDHFALFVELELFAAPTRREHTQVQAASNSKAKGSA